MISCESLAREAFMLAECWMKVCMSVRISGSPYRARVVGLFDVMIVVTFCCRMLRRKALYSPVCGLMFRIMFMMRKVIVLGMWATMSFVFPGALLRRTMRSDRVVHHPSLRKFPPGFARCVSNSFCMPRSAVRVFLSSTRTSATSVYRLGNGRCECVYPVFESQSPAVSEYMLTSSTLFPNQVRTTARRAWRDLPNWHH